MIDPTHNIAFSSPNTVFGAGAMPTQLAVRGGEDVRIAPNDATYTVLMDLFPEGQMVEGGFRQLSIPAGFTSTSQAWYGLIDLDFGRSGQEFCLFGLTADVGSTDSSAGAGFSNWGATGGDNAAIVIGNHLPSKLGQWVSAPCNVPALQNETRNAFNQWWWVGGFPPGNWSDDQFRVRDNKAWSPFVFRIPQASRLQAALVIDGADAQAAAGSDPIQGMLDLQLSIGLTRNTNTYETQR